MGIDFMKNALMMALSLAAVTLPATSATAATSVSVNTGGSNAWLVSNQPSNNYGTAFIPTEVHPNWIGGSSNAGINGAQWITQFNPGTANVPEGEAYFQLVFNMGNISQLATRALSGTFFADNSVLEIFLNGNLIGGSLAGGAGGTFEGNGTAFGTTNATHFVSGDNTLRFRIRNDGPTLPDGTFGENPAGLLVSGLASAVPEPGTWMLMMLGLGAVGFSMRRRQKTQVRFQFA
jgi:hypothetical protein